MCVCTRDRAHGMQDVASGATGHAFDQAEPACMRAEPLEWACRTFVSQIIDAKVESAEIASYDRERKVGGGGRERETETEGDRDRDRQRWIETKKDREDVSQRSESACRTAGPVTNGSEETKAHGAKANGHSRERKAQLHTALSKLEQGKTNSHRLEAPTERRQSLEHAVGRKGGIHCSSGSP